MLDDESDAPACLSTTELLTAEELISLRKPAEETHEPVVGEKFYTPSNSLLEKKALECALENYKDVLDKKRVGKICDLMQGEWSTELKAVTVLKLKGKFSQHMGCLVNGKNVLAPEEAVFLLENNCIEIMHNNLPMSTEEAFSMILKGNLGLEKYEVYSHLSKLGYVVVPHRAEVGITEYEKAMNLDKHPFKKRHIKEPVEGEPEKKRLTFTGAFSAKSESTSEASKKNSVSNSESEINSLRPATSMEETIMPEKSDLNTVCDKFAVENNVHSDAEDQNSKKGFTNQVMENIQHDIDEINHTSVSISGLEVRCEDKGTEVSKDNKNEVSASDFKGLEENENFANETGEKTKSNEMVPLGELTESSKLQNDILLRNHEKQDLLDSNSQSSKIVDIMDVTDGETSCSASEISRDRAFDSNVNVASQDSCISMKNDGNTPGDANSDMDVLDSSSISLVDEEEEVLALDANNPIREDEDEVTLIEVTKKETKPLAVIDLLSDDDNDNAENEDVDDDDITFLEEYPSPPFGNPPPLGEMNSKNYSCKKEEEGAVLPSSKLIPPLTVQFPDLFRKRVVCVARPPLHLLPNHVKPAKETYVLNLKRRNPEQSRFNNRVWSSYRDMQDYQRQRRHNSNSRGQSFSASHTWNDRSSRNREGLHRPGFGSDQTVSTDVNSHPNSLLGQSPVDLRRNLSSVNSFQGNISLPNPTRMNCEVTIKEDESENLVSSSSQSSHSSNISIPHGMPNNSFMNPVVSSTNFTAGNTFNMGNVSHSHLIAELQRTCFTVATNVLSSMFNRNPTMMPNPSMFPSGPFNPSMSNGFCNSHVPGGHDCFPMPHHNFCGAPRRCLRGRPFPCRYRNIGNKQSWSDVRSAVCDSSSSSSDSDSDSDIEEMPITPREILWNDKGICPLVKPGVHYPVGSVLKFLQITQKAKVTSKYGCSEKLLPNFSNLEISFDVYAPGFTYKKTRPQIPKYRIVVVKSTDPIPNYSDIAILQRKWADDATLLIAVNDNGDISFQSFNSISLPLLTPHDL